MGDAEELCVEETQELSIMDKNSVSDGEGRVINGSLIVIHSM